MGKIICTTTNASNMNNAVGILLNRMRSAKQNMFKNIESIYVRCTVHIVNLAVRGCMKLLPGKARRTRKLMNSIR